MQGQDILLLSVHLKLNEQFTVRVYQPNMLNHWRIQCSNIKIYAWVRETEKGRGRTTKYCSTSNLRLQNKAYPIYWPAICFFLLSSLELHTPYFRSISQSHSALYRRNWLSISILVQCSTTWITDQRTRIGRITNSSTNVRYGINLSCT